MLRQQRYLSLLDHGVDEETARAAANDEAIVSSIIEMSDTAVDLATLGAAGKFGNKLTKKAADWAGTNIAKNLGLGLAKYGINIASEAAEEILQEAVSIANENRTTGGDYLADRIGAGGIGGLALTAGDVLFNGTKEDRQRMLEAGEGGAMVGAATWLIPSVSDTVSGYSSAKAGTSNFAKTVESFKQEALEIAYNNKIENDNDAQRVGKLIRDWGEQKKSQLDQLYENGTLYAQGSNVSELKAAIDDVVNRVSEETAFVQNDQQQTFRRTSNMLAENADKTLMNAAHEMNGVDHTEDAAYNVENNGVATPVEPPESKVSIIVGSENETEKAAPTVPVFSETDIAEHNAEVVKTFSDTFRETAIKNVVNEMYVATQDPIGYTQAMGAAYAEGKAGLELDVQPIGASEPQIRAAYLAGQNEYNLMQEDNYGGETQLQAETAGKAWGEDLQRGDSGRVLGQRAGEPVGSLEEGTRGASSKAPLVEDRDAREVIRKAEPGQKVAIVPEDYDDDVKKDYALAKRNGVKIREWTDGERGILAEGLYRRGCTDTLTGEITIQKNNKSATSTQILKHEIAERTFADAFDNSDDLNFAVDEIIDEACKHAPREKIYGAVSTYQFFGFDAKELVCDAAGMINQGKAVGEDFSDILPAIHDAVESFMNKHGRSVSDEISKAERVEKSSEAKGKNLNGIEYSSYLGYNSPANKKLRIRFNGKIETSLVGGISKSEYGIIRNALKSGKNVVLSENGLSGGVYSANVFYTFDVYGEEVVLTGEIGIEHALDAMEASKQYEQNGTLYDSGYAERERGIKARRHGNTPESVSDGLLREVQKMAGEEQNGQLYGNARGGKETKNGGREILSSSEDKNRYSSELDSEGTGLSEKQIEFFKDSAVRDNNGNLVVMYHGTKSDFTEFKKGNSKNWNMLGDGFYFTPDKRRADAYGRGGKTIDAYLNIKNPLVSKNEDHIEKLCRSIGKPISYIKKWAEKKKYGGSDLFLISQYADDHGIDIRQHIEDLSFDGVMYYSYHFLNYILRLEKNSLLISKMHKELKEESPYTVTIKSRKRVYKYGKYRFVY